MINQAYRLIAPKQIRADFVDLKINNENVIVRPTYLSICAADQRYYTGSRGRVIMKQKLPMALIHESVGEVVYDPKGEYPVGTNVVMIPNTPMEHDNIIKENYPNVIIKLKYTPNIVSQTGNYYVYLTPKSGIITGISLINTTTDYIFEGGEVQIGDMNDPTVCNVSLSITIPSLPTQSPSATLTMSKVQTTKYQHNLRFYYQQTIATSTTKYVPTNFTTTIINDSPTAFNASTLLSYLNTNGLTSSTKCLSISGIHRTSSGIAYILSGLSRASSTNAQVHGMNVAQLQNASQSLPISSVTITLTNGYLYDTVVEI